jgi:hypothetical protein
MRTTVSAVAAVLCFLLSQTLAFSAQPQATLDVTVSAAATGVQTVDGCPIYTAGDVEFVGRYQRVQYRRSR